MRRKTADDRSKVKPTVTELRASGKAASRESASHPEDLGRLRLCDTPCALRNSNQVLEPHSHCFAAIVGGVLVGSTATSTIMTIDSPGGAS
jgi:hypothetical protein